MRVAATAGPNIGTSGMANVAASIILFIPATSATKSATAAATSVSWKSIAYTNVALESITSKIAMRTTTACTGNANSDYSTSRIYGSETASGVGQRCVPNIWDEVS